MKRLFATVAISALALSGAAFAADAPATVTKTQPPVASTPAMPSTGTTLGTKADDGHAKKSEVIKKDKTSLNATQAVKPVQQAQAPIAAPALGSTKPMVDDGKKPAVTKKSDAKPLNGTESTTPSTTSPAKPAIR
jgi:hypothetical protein